MMTVPKSFAGKLILTGGKGAFPCERSVCKINLSSTQSSVTNTCLNSRWIQRDGVYDVTIGEADCEIDQGLEYALTIMTKGERSKVDLKDGSIVHEVIVELIEFSVSAPFFKLDASEKIALAKRHKSVGIELFKNYQVIEAFYRFSKCIKYIVPLRIEDSDSEEVTLLYSSVCNNMALCQLQVGNFDHAIILCDKVLNTSPKNVKALLRRADALMQLKRFDKAEEDLKQILSLEPVNKLALRNYDFVKKKLEEQEKTYANMVKKMFPFR